MNRLLISLCALLVLAIPALCIGQVTRNESGPVTKVPVTPLAPTISGQRMAFTAGLFLDQLRIVVRDRDTWVEVWNRINSGPNSHNAPPMPEIDFTSEILVVAAMGLRPSSGFQITIDTAYLYESFPRLEVVVRSVENTRCGGFTVLTAPIDIVRIPRTERPVIFRETQVIAECGKSIHNLRVRPRRF